MYIPFLHDFINLFFPLTCLACDRLLVSNQKVLCAFCLALLPTRPEEIFENPTVAEKFLGAVPIRTATALFRFTGLGKVQKIIHKIKYKNKSKSAEQLGRYYGILWKRALTNAPLDVIIPVPLHSQRLAEREYNQSTLITKGMAAILSIPYKTNWLIRSRYTETQTKKTKIARQKNVVNAFQVTNKAVLQDKHVLLIDDLITTGATLKECAQVLLKANPRTISIATLAVAV